MNINYDAEFRYRLMKLFLINLQRADIISAETAEKLRDELINEYNPPIGILEEKQPWQIEL